ncbi:hypothetical protein [Curtobacterium sp. MCPF17_021]|uniref:hypothetical protein n=1 Tax=Curtobacterium sp. MCPF17_021 TaxID=2175639 RepID=UPI0015E8A7D3|nr:hypothetical protein [Curtobacterium sp. MCPF17_021]WIE84488.1 hypothetical protein DEJ29_006465 [Curtobacterium sp. MCPF17_021]
MGHAQGISTTVTDSAVWQQVVHTDRIRALAATDPTDIRVQPVDAGCWRVVDAAAAWGDPDMLLGFIERTVDGFDCTLMAALHEHDRRASLQDARAWFEHRCGKRFDEAPC